MLEKYSLVYHIVILPGIVVYSAIVPAVEYLYFDNKLNLPRDLHHLPIDCFFTIYDEEGNYVANAHEQASYLSLQTVVNTVPLKLIKEVLTSIEQS